MLCGVFSENIGCTITCVELARRLKTMPGMAMFWWKETRMNDLMWRCFPKPLTSQCMRVGVPPVDSKAVTPLSMDLVENGNMRHDSKISIHEAYVRSWRSRKDTIIAL
jgi:hypothetical protein